MINEYTQTENQKNPTPERETKIKKVSTSKEAEIKKIVKELITDKDILDSVMWKKPELLHQMISQFIT